MFDEKINKNELKILKLLVFEKKNISHIASEINRSISWTSECISHLESIGLVNIEKKGVSRFVKISSKPLGESMLLLLMECEFLNLENILTRSGLIILPLFLQPGSTASEISKRTNKSLRTVQKTIKMSNNMGIIIKNKKTKKFSFNPKQRYLIQFVVELFKYRNRVMLNEKSLKAIILWEWRDEFLFTIMDQMSYPIFIPAAITRLDELMYDLIHTSEYYFYSPGLKKISIEEAFIQTIKTNMDNPRVFKKLRDAILDKKIDQDLLLKYAKKYGLKTKIANEVLSVA